MKQVLLTVIVLATAVLGYEAWESWRISSAAAVVRQANQDRQIAIKKRETELRTLENGKAAIGVVHARLVDSTVPPDVVVAAPPAIPGAPRAAAAAPTFRLPAPFETLQREGARWNFTPRELPAGDRARAVRGTAVAEFHRLLPPLTAMENLFPLVTTDEIVLSLPPGVPPFSPAATQLSIEATFRVPLRLATSQPSAPTKR